MEQIFQPLTEKNFFQYCNFHYKNSSCFSEDEFLQDLRSAQNIKKLLNRQSSGQEINERILINHIILLSNVFGVLPALRILYHVCGEEHYSSITKYCKELNFFNQYNIEILRKYDGIFPSR